MSGPLHVLLHRAGPGWVAGTGLLTVEVRPWLALMAR